MKVQIMGNQRTINQQKNKIDCEHIRVTIGENIYEIYQDEGMLVISSSEQITIEPATYYSIRIDIQ